MDLLDSEKLSESKNQIICDEHCKLMLLTTANNAL